MAELSVTRKNISNLFTGMQGKKFIVPDYQRPYKWDKEKCETLWQDITSFHDSEKNDNEEYFFGTIVTCKSIDKDDCKEFEIIDGQQRITSFLLLLRAFYTKLEFMSIHDPSNDQIIGLKNQIAPCIWDIDPISQKVNDKSKIHIESKVATDNDKLIFHSLLELGIVTEKQDLYSKNYKFFYDNCENYARENPLRWYSLCVTILRKCIILPIECNNSDTALTIFSTLNDRGLPLEDSDIFKAKIYQSKTPDSRKEFTEDWKELTETVKSANISLDDIFRNYSHILRAKANDKSKEIALRKFYTAHNYENIIDPLAKLKEPNLMYGLKELANFWLYINTNKNNDLNNDINNESKKYLHILSCYPNEYWKYITSVFFFKNKDKSEFTNLFTSFLKKLTAFLFIKFIENPTVNAIKDDIYLNYIQINDNEFKNFKFILKKEEENELKKKIESNSTNKISRALILLQAYLNENQKSLLPSTFDIEHILPIKWQNTMYNGWNEDDAKVYINKFGNKVAIEKMLNIQAGNGYFGNKKKKYQESKVEEVKKLCEHEGNDWAKEDIEKREVEFIGSLIEFFNSNLNNN